MPTYTIRVEKFVQYSFEMEADADNVAEAMEAALEQANLDPDLFEREEAESEPRIYSILNQENGADITLDDLSDHVAIESCLSDFAAKVESAVAMEVAQFGREDE